MAQLQRQLRDVLIEQGLVTVEEMEAAEGEEASSGKSAWRVLLEQGRLKEEDLVQARAAQVGMPYVDARTVQPHPEALAAVPAEVARRQGVLPLRFDGDVLVVAMAEPANHLALDELAQVSGRQITLAAAYRADLATAINRAYAGGEAASLQAAALQGAALQGAASPGPTPQAATVQPPPAQPVTPGPAPTAPGVPGTVPGVPPAAPPGNGGAATGRFGADDVLVEAPARPAAEPVVEVVEETEKEPNLADFLMAVVDGAGSDLHLTGGLPPMIRVHGELQPLEGYRKLYPQDLQQLIYSMLTQKQRELFEENLELDISYALPGKARFRVNVFQQRDAVGSVMRIIPFEIKNLESLGVPGSVKEFARLRRGLVLVTGITGSGKSTTLAALVDMINEERSEHIMTVEDPIEFLHRHKKSVVNQREVGADTHGFGNALKHVLRQDPDVILVGEMRDLETISAALTAAETGHLVFATLHTQDAPQSVDRVIDVFPPHQQQQIRIQLAGTLAGVVSQQLLPTVDGRGRVVACEVLVVTPAVRNLIREGKTHQIYTSMQAGGKFGMQVMDQHLAELVKKGKITYEMALERSHHVEEFNRLAGRG